MVSSYKAIKDRGPSRKEVYIIYYIYIQLETIIVNPPLSNRIKLDPLAQTIFGQFIPPTSR